jgi:hypothetical protein
MGGAQSFIVSIGFLAFIAAVYFIGLLRLQFFSFTLS